MNVANFIVCIDGNANQGECMARGILAALTPEYVPGTFSFSFSNTQRSENSIIRNQKKLGVIERLSDDWNGNGANSFSKELVDKVRLLLDEILHQPEIFPTAGDSIQLEYDRNNGQHLEFEISENNDIEVYEELLDGKTEEYSIPFDVNSINEVLRRFYDE